jgi:hypothetical protein
MISYCNQTLSGIGVACDPSKGGIVEAYVALYEDIPDSAITTDESTGSTSAATDDTPATMVTGISVTGATKWHKYSFKKNTGSMTSTLNVDDANGVNFVQTELVLQFNRMDTSKRLEMAALSIRDLRVVVKDANGVYWLLGLNEPVSASAGTGQTGTARTDGNYYQITLQSNDDTYPIPVLASVAESLIGE